ncbi:sensor histidine kinase [Microbacterium oxydans]|uniref:sensor histidine kinase n=1 Tax=Microbacterium oxydans TaxID=82380 RepID=UPI00226B38F6|nr:ATP-binding protein [Microbacterium oxydans]WAA65614.1 histidine kinase [Microbacterium oxydans]
MNTQIASLSVVRPAEMKSIDLAVDISFAVLLVVCGSRYLGNHGLDDMGALVLAGASVSWIAYLIGRVGHPTPVRRRIGAGLAIGIWMLLVVGAPSFAWCAVPLFFAAHRAYPTGWAFGVTALIVIAVGVSLFRWSEWSDAGMLFGPLCAGGILTLAYAALERLHEVRGALIAELEDTQQRLSLTEREAGIETERRRVAAELHDTVVQGTASALLLLETDEQRMGTVSPGAARAQDVLRANLVETRRLVNGLSTADLAGRSLGAALADVAAEAGAQLHMIGTERPVTESQAHALLRVAQEAVANASRHARAERIIVTLTYAASQVGVDVGDDGAGFDVLATPDPEAGYGLRAMRWRAITAGGELEVASAPGMGTIVSITVPTHDTDIAG